MASTNGRDERQRISGFDFVEQPLEHASQCKCSEQAERDTNAREAHSLADDEAKDGASLRSQGHANADLARALGHHAGQDAIKTQRGKQQCAGPESAEQMHREPPLGEVRGNKLRHRLHALQGEVFIEQVEFGADGPSQVGRIALRTDDKGQKTPADLPVRCGTFRRAPASAIPTRFMSLTTPMISTSSLPSPMSMRRPIGFGPSLKFFTKVSSTIITARRVVLSRSVKSRPCNRGVFIVRNNPDSLGNNPLPPSRRAQAAAHLERLPKDCC